MHRKLNLASATIAVLALAIACAAANAQSPSRPASTPQPAPTPTPQNQTIVNTTKSNVKEHAALASETGGAGGWDGKVQGRALVTPLVVTFDNPADYDNFAAGKLRLNLLLKNALSGQTIRLDSRQLTQSFQPGADKRSLTIDIVVDNMSAPLSEATCGQVTPSAENTGEGVDITLSYSGCGGGQAQRPGNPIHGIMVKGGKNEGAQMTAGQPIGGIVVKGGKNPGGNLNIAVGGSSVVESSEAYMKLKINPSSNGVKRAEASNVIIISTSNKGAGSPKVNGF